MVKNRKTVEEKFMNILRSHMRICAKPEVEWIALYI